jgi:hypothetical protein
MADIKTYTGSCHCGSVRFEASTDLKKVIQCNCSICSRAGHLLTFVPPDQFKLLQGEDQLKDYQFHHKRIHHLFCSNCGVRSFGQGTTPGGKQMYAVNVRCLEGVEPSALDVTHFDGKSI